MKIIFILISILKSGRFNEMTLPIAAQPRPLFIGLEHSWPAAIPAIELNPWSTSHDSFISQASQPDRDQADAKPPVTAAERTKKGLIAAGLLGGALLLGKYPSSARFTEHLIPTDWKMWAKAAMGIGATNQITQALNWKPPVWLNAMGAVAVVHPLIAGFSKQSARKLVVLAPMVGGLVQGTSWLSERTEKLLDDKVDVPPIATKLAFSAGMMGLGLFAFPPLLKEMTRKGILGKVAKAELIQAEKALKETTRAGIDKSKQAISQASDRMIAAQVCARGCCASAVCVSELGEFASATWGWLTNQPAKTEGKERGKA